MSIEVERRELDEPLEAAQYGQYRELSAMAVASSTLALISSLALLSWVFSIIPLCGIAAGLTALRRIRNSPAELTGERLALAGVLLSSLFMIGGWTRLSYIYATEVPPGYERINYDMLQPRLEDPAEGLPARITELDGKKVFIKGYMFPPVTGQTRDISTFMLVRDKGDCCFGGSPKITDMILVRLKNQLRMDYNQRVKKLAGTFRVQSGQAVDGLGGVLFHLDAEHAE